MTHHHTTADVPDIAVIGGGVIGLAVAWRLSRLGCSVTVHDPEPGRGASWAAAGMLAPVSEVGPGEAGLLALGAESLARWPAFAAELAAETGTDVGLRPEGTLTVAFDDDDRRTLEDVGDLHRHLGIDSGWLTRRECRRREPLLNPRVTGGLLAPGDLSVDNRVLLAALAEAGRRRGVRTDHRGVRRVVVRSHRVTGVELTDGTVRPAGTVVVAAGAWSGGLAGLPASATPPVRPVKGEILRLRSAPEHPVLSGTVRARVRTWSVYLVPRASGELVVGASSEEAGFDTTVRAGAVFELLRAATTIVPAVGELELVEAIARLRPGTPDNGPVIGPTPVDGLLLATGHHRNGVLLTPVTADAIGDVLEDGKVGGTVGGFGLDRFA